MTMRQIDIALKQIDRRTHNTFALRAALHGLKIPIRSTPSMSPTVTFTPEEEAAATRAVSETLAQKQAELRRRNGQ